MFLAPEDYVLRGFVYENFKSIKSLIDTTNSKIKLLSLQLM